LRPRPVPAVLAVALTVLLAACTADPQPSPTGGAASASPSAAALDPEAVVETVTIPSDGHDVRVDVHPLVRADDLVVLTLDLGVPGAGEDVDVFLQGWGATSRIVPTLGPTAIRLLDLQNDVAHHAGLGADERPVVAPGEGVYVRSVDGVRVQLPYAAPPAGVEHLAVLVPGAPLIAGVPVVDGDVPVALTPAQQDARAATASPTSTAAATPDPAPVLDLDAVVEAGTYPLEQTSRELEGAVQTVESAERLEITLGADVLFAFDSADLDPAAQGAVAVVAQRLAERAPGTVEVVGHTDDQGDDAYNDDLSRRRAQSVADALGAVVDTAAYPLRVDGRGEREPFVPNDSDDNRALNRRVTVTLTSTVVTSVDVTTRGELPPFEKGSVGTGGEPVRVESGGRQFDVTASARRVDGHVVVDLEVANADGASGLHPMAFLTGENPARRGLDSTSPLNATGFTSVVDGATQVFVLDYAAATNATWPAGEFFPAGPLGTGGQLDTGQQGVFSYVFPASLPDVVALQLGTGRLASDLRITGIEVGDEATGAGEE
jgi:outer membrane protein OmpA-like peptidoglycan-associated protein